MSDDGAPVEPDGIVITSDAEGDDQPTPDDGFKPTLHHPWIMSR
jgi:hypothetical protein